MPYIKVEERKRLEPILAEFDKINRDDITVGNLNYLITSMFLMTNPSRYHDYNALIGVLECCKLEFYRRAVSLVEDDAIERNGDIF